MRNATFTGVLTFLLTVLCISSFAKTSQENCVNNPRVSYCIDIDPKGYLGAYYIPNISANELTGHHRYLLPVGQNQISIGTNGHNQEIHFEVMSNGKIANISNPTAVKTHWCNKKKLIFNNVTVAIDPDQYQGAYYPSIYHRLGNELQTGKIPFIFVPGLEYYVELYGSGFSENEIKFQVDAGGNIRNVGNSEAARAVGKSLVFNNVKVVINPTTYAGTYNFAKMSKSGQQEPILVPNTRLLVYIQESNSNNDYCQDANNRLKCVSIKTTHVEPATLDLIDTNGNYQKFLFAVRLELALTNCWKGEDRPNDSCGDKNGTVNPTVTYVAGKMGRAFNFDGGNSYVKVNNPFLLNGGAVDFWFNWNGNPQDGPRGLIGSCVAENNTGRCDNRTPLIFIKQNNLGWEFSNDFHPVVTSINPNHWYHVTFTYVKYNNKYAIAFYVGDDDSIGKLIDAKIDIANISTFYSDFAIGNFIPNGGYTSFNGSIDEVKVYKLQ